MRCETRAPTVFAEVEHILDIVLTTLLGANAKTLLGAKFAHG